MTVHSAVTKVHLDSGGDDPAQARAEIAALVDALNTLRTHLLTSTITSGSSVASATGGVEVSSTDLRTTLSVAAKSATYTALTTDRAKVLNFTSAGFDLDFTAAATLGDGWWCVVLNSASSGALALDPNSTENINGSSSSLNLHPGDMALVFCNGTGLFAFVSRAGDYFHVHKNGSNQGSISNGDTQITFGTEDADTAGVFNTGTSRFVPAAGQRWHISATLHTTDGNDQMFVRAVIYKNGSVFKRGAAQNSGNAVLVGCSVDAVVEGNGTDYYEIYFTLSNSVATRTIDGGSDDTYFQGVRFR
jgi:hypothetical protein